MARRRRIGKAHPRFFKYLTIFGATVGIAGSSAFAVLMGAGAAKGDFISEEVREYTASFSSEGSLISRATYKRGEELEVPANPEHTVDGEYNYFFVGWDTNGNGIPDYMPDYMPKMKAYYSFDAEAVYFTTGKFDLNFLDLMNMDLEDLMSLLENLDIDWEQFMSMFNIDPEALMEWLSQQIILSYRTYPTSTQYPIYFRSTSFGDFDYAKKNFKSPEYYDSSLISANSVNPLSFTAYKLKKLEEFGALPSGFGFIDYDITFATVQDYYPVPDCELTDGELDIVNSDAHYLLQPKDNKYHTSAVYCPAFGYVIDLLDAIPLSGTVYRDEKAYYKYALEHYTSIPQEYENVIDDMIYENDWYEEELFQVDSIAAYVSKLGKCSLFNDDGEIDVTGYVNSKNENKDPVNGLIENGRGSDLDFNTTAVMLFRRLNIPARLVKGYVAAGSQPGDNSISLFNQHYWCEIYVKGTGWMICDCMDLSAIIGTNPYEDLDQQNTPLENKHILDRIVVHNPYNTEYNIGDDFNYADGSITAYFQDGQTSNLSFISSGVEIIGFDSSTVGPIKITVKYTYEGVSKTGTFFVNIKDQNNKIVRIDFDTEHAVHDYYEGEDFDLTKITATAWYQNGDFVDVSPLMDYRYYKSEQGSYNVQVGVWNEDTADLADNLKSTYVDVTVYHKRVVAILFDEPPMAKMSYYQGEDFVDPYARTNGQPNLRVYFRYYTGEDEDVTNKYPYNIYYPSSYDMTQVGLHTVTVEYQNDKPGDGLIQSSFDIEVTENGMTKLNVTGYKDTYFAGETFNQSTFLNGATATVDFLHTESKPINVNELQFVSTPSLLTTGEKTVTVRYTNANNDYIEANLTINVIGITGTIDVTYLDGAEYEVDYDGYTHYDRINYKINYPADWPSFLTVRLSFVPDDDVDTGTELNVYTYHPVISSIVNQYNQDVTAQYNLTIDGGAEGVTYFVNPVSATVTLSSSGTHAPNSYFYIDYQASGLVSGDQVVLIDDYVSYPYVGKYNNYPTQVKIMRGGVDVTDCYDLTVIRNMVEIRD